MTERVTVFGAVEEKTRAQLERSMTASGPDSLGVLCADNHPGYGMPIGGVVASQTHVMPAGVGVDIGCGNMAVRTPVLAADLDMRRVMDEVWKVISFGMGQKNGEEMKDHPVYQDIMDSPVRAQRLMIQSARNQLGTVGGGNHYVDLFVDADGLVWIGVHFGSRGFGFKTAKGFLALAAGLEWDARTSDDMDDQPLAIPLGTQLADDYLAGMEIAGAYAHAGREWVVERVLRILGLSLSDTTFHVHNHHNYAWWEEHQNQRWLVTRKGATPAFPRQEGFVGANMLDEAVILRGVDSDRSKAALYSTVHGAGRAMSRRQAGGKTKAIGKWRCQDHRKCSFAGAKGGFRKGPNGETPKCPLCGHKLRLEWMSEQVTKGVIDWDAVLGELARRKVELRGGAADEAPGAYKVLSDVLSHHDGTVEILHRLRPIGVAMAGLETHDPYKD